MIGLLGEVPLCFNPKLFGGERLCDLERDVFLSRLGLLLRLRRLSASGEPRLTFNFVRLCVYEPDLERELEDRLRRRLGMERDGDRECMWVLLPDK